MSSSEAKPNPFDTLSGPFALVFPGQGSQFVGMGKTLAEQSPAARQLFAEADEILGFSLSTLCAEGPAEELEDTYNSQSAIFVTSVAALLALRDAGGATHPPMMVAGHSLGEFTALVATQSLAFPDALRLVRERGRLMKEAGTRRPGGMAAILGIEDDALEAVVAETKGDDVLVIANANCPGQTVISGELAPLERAVALAKERGAKRAVRLPISIASHSPLMADAAEGLRARLAEIAIQDPIVPVVANASAALLRTAADVRAELNTHLESPVRWTATIQAMTAAGVTATVEVGPGQALTGLIKRIDRTITTLRLEDFGLTAT